MSYYFVEEKVIDVGGWLLWGTPNLSPDNQLIRPSNCRACAHWTYAGWVVDVQRYAEGCAIHKSREFPDVKGCSAYASGPGSVDE